MIVADSHIFIPIKRKWKRIAMWHRTKRVEKDIMCVSAVWKRKMEWIIMENGVRWKKYPCNDLEIFC